MKTIRISLALLALSLLAAATVPTAGAAGGAPVAGTAPSISGDPREGQTLTADPGTWSGSPSFTYQWQRCLDYGAASGSPGAGGALLLIGGLTGQLWPAEHFRLDDASTDAAAEDAAGNGQAGVYSASGVTLGVPGLVVGSDTAASFDGGGDLQDSGWPLDGTAFALDLWARPAALPAAGSSVSLAARPDSFALEITADASGKAHLVFRVFDGNAWHAATGAAALAAGRVYHAVATFGHGELTVYVNGAADGSASFAGAVQTAETPTVFGRGFAGTLDEVVVWDGAGYGEAVPGPEQVAQEFQVGTTGCYDISASEVSSATSPAYAVPSSDAAWSPTRLRVRVTATNADGTTEAVSAPTAVVQRPKLYPTEGPWINNGANQTFVGKPLSASDGTWFGADPISLSIEWQRCVEHDFPGYYAAARGCVDIPGATASGYTPTEADRGLFLRKVVTATNADGSWRIESNGVGPVTTFGGPIYIANRPTYEAGACAAVGCSNTVVPNPNGNWYSSDWTPLAPLAIQWARCTGELWTTCTDIAGATDATYTVQRADVGSYLRARVTATNDVGSTSIYTDAPLGPVTG